MRFKVDLDAVADFAADLRSYSAAVEQALADAQSQVARLHAEWSGSAADAHAAGHARWHRDTEAVRTALNDIQQIVSTAHANYSEAVTVNRGMWNQL